MKKLILICFTLGAFLIGFSARAGESDLAISQQDRQLHAAASYGLTLAGTEFLKARGAPMPWLISSVGVFAIGILKESTDKKFSDGDMRANSLGIAGAVCTSFIIHF